MTLLTRKDANVGAGIYDSIQWAFEVHVKQPDNPAINSAVLCGNEDAPASIDFYAEAEPLVTSVPVLKWTPKE